MIGVNISGGVNDVGIVNKGIAYKLIALSRYDGSGPETKPLCSKYIDEGDSDNEPNRRTHTIALTNALERNFYGAIRGGANPVCCGDIMFNFL